MHILFTKIIQHRRNRGAGVNPSVDYSKVVAETSDRVYLKACALSSRNSNLTIKHIGMDMLGVDRLC